MAGRLRLIRARRPPERRRPPYAPAPRQWLLLAGYALATFLSFPHPVGDGVVDLGLGVAWLAPAFLLLGLDGLTPGAAARAGFLAGWVAHTAVLHWIYVVTVRYGGAPPWAGVLAPAVLAAYAGLSFAAIGAGWAWLDGRGRATPWTGALLWTAVEQSRSWLLTGFPWAVIGYAQHDNPLLRALAPLTGVTGLSFVVALGGAALACAARDLARRRAPGRQPVAALLVVAALHVFGAVRGAPTTPPGTPTVRVAGLQGNIDQGVKWNAAWVERTLGVYEDLTRRAVAAGARVVVWPETAVPGVIEGQPELRQRLGRLARASRVTLVVGAVGVDPGPGGGGWRYYDSAFVISPQGAWVDRYDKTHLVPFGEYIPLRWLWGTFLEAVARGIAPADVAAGAAPRAVEIPVPPPRPGSAGSAGPSAPRELRVGIPVCYELLFPQLVRHFAADGARLLLAITNDAWYGRTGAPYQFLAMTELRSAETGLWTVRAANTGVSAVIDAAGRVLQRTPIFEQGSVIADVPLSPPGVTTFYVRHGEWFATLCWLGLAVAVGEAVARSRRTRHAGRMASPDQRRAES